MKKSLYLMLVLVLVAGALTSCASKPGDALVIVSGKITKTNSGDTYVFDQAAFESKSVESTYNDPWMGDGLKYKGLMLKDMLNLVKPANDATTITLIGTDGKGFDVAIADAQKYNIMLAHWVDGNLLTEKNGGPVKIAYPDDAKGTYADEQWAWWIVKIEIK